MEFHPIANLFPMMSVEEFKALKESIRKHGQRIPIYTHEGKIVDGRNRYQACRELGIKPYLEGWDGKGLLVDFVWDLNAERRQLTGGALHIAAAKYAIERQTEAKQRQGARTDLTSGPIGPEVSFGKSTDKAAEKFNLGRTTVKRAVRVVKHGASELLQAVESGQASVHSAAQIVALPIEKQKEIVARGKNEILKTAKEIERQQIQKRAHGLNGVPKSISQQLREKEENKEIKVQGVGVTHAHEAINCLKRIPKNDGLRKRGFQIVTDWIKHNQ
jgi:ParB-like chromosome segregation protein Spo0J